YSLAIPPGTHDLFALHWGGGGDLVVDQVAVMRNVAVTATTQQDISAAGAALVQSFPVSIPTSGTQKGAAVTTLYSAGGTIVPLVKDASAPRETNALFPGQMAPGDIYEQVMTVTSTGQLIGTSSATGAPAAQTFAPPAPLAGVATTVATSTPYPELKTTWSAYPNAVGYAWTADQILTGLQCGGSTACRVEWTALISAGVAGAAPVAQMPDLSAISGWSPKLKFLAGTMISGSVEAVTSTAGASDFPATSPPAIGTQHVLVRSDYTVTP
ncbi:MAG: hypothetical protein ACHQNA_14915, partial [Acidimicrobiales bacterium]